MFSVYDNDTQKRVSDESYATAEEADHDYHMNSGHTHVAPIRTFWRPVIIGAGYED